jgi:hypothetical protein
MRYLAERLAILESKQATSLVPNSAVDRTTSSRASSVNSDFRSSSVSGTKRKVDSCPGDVERDQGRKTRYSRLQSPSADYGSPADGEYIVEAAGNCAYAVPSVLRASFVSVA